MLAWTLLVIAGLLEVFWALGLKRVFVEPSVPLGLAVVVTMVLSFVLLGMALRELPVGTAYAVWTGIGVIGTVGLGIVWFGEPATVARLACIGLILGGVAGLKVLS